MTFVYFDPDKDQDIIFRLIDKGYRIEEHPETPIAMNIHDLFKKLNYPYFKAIMKYPTAFKDYCNFSGKDNIDFITFIRWSALYGVNAFIIDDSADNTRFRYVLTKNGVREESGDFLFWPDAIDDMVDKILEYIDPFAEIRASKEPEDKKAFLRSYILKSANSMAYLVDSVTRDEDVSEMIDSVIETLKASKQFL